MNYKSLTPSLQKQLIEFAEDAILVGEADISRGNVLVSRGKKKAGEDLIARGDNTVSIYEDMIQKIDHFGELSEGQLRIFQNGEQIFKTNVKGWKHDFPPEAQALLSPPPEIDNLAELFNLSGKMVDEVDKLNDPFTKQDLIEVLGCFVEVLQDKFGEK